jgi:hypothetical protein
LKKSLVMPIPPAVEAQGEVGGIPMQGSQPELSAKLFLLPCLGARLNDMHPHVAGDSMK